MSRRLIVCLDGTGNEIETNESNILRLYKCLDRNDDQLVYYVPGVGTLDTRPFSRMVLAKPKLLLGLIAGFGLEANVMRAFQFLCDNYGDGDRIYLFGYSRGAYTARVLAGFINDFGLVAPQEFHLVAPAFRAWRKIGDNPQRKDYAKLRMLEKAFQMKHPPIRFMGLWDTVSSMIRIRLGNGTIVQHGTHSSVNVNPSVQSVRHVLAIDETRRFFRHQFWKIGQKYWGSRSEEGEPSPQDVKQVWFAGTHTDVAGSVKEIDAGLSKITIQWMRGELDDLGADKLFFRDPVYERYVLGIKDNVTREMNLTFSAPNSMAPLHSQMKKGWFLLEGLPRLIRRSRWPSQKGLLGYYLPLGQRRYIPKDAELHPTVKDRIDASDMGYDPPNLKDR